MRSSVTLRLRGLLTLELAWGGAPDPAPMLRLGMLGPLLDQISRMGWTVVDVHVQEEGP